MIQQIFLDRTIDIMGFYPGLAFPLSLLHGVGDEPAAFEKRQLFLQSLPGWSFQSVLQEAEILQVLAGSGAMASALLYWEAREIHSFSRTP